MPRFENRVRAYGTFVVEAADVYAADEIATSMPSNEILSKVDWLGISVNDDEFPEEV